MTSSKNPADPAYSLREFRREQTWSTLHTSAVELVEKKGLRSTTTDEIARTAGVSPRTFFNYFSTKEDAILGLKSPEITAEILAADTGRNQRFIVERLVHLMLDILLYSMPVGNQIRYRQLVQEHPEFRQRLKTHLNDCENTLENFLQRVDWDRFQQASRRGDFPFLPEESLVSAETEKKTRAAVSLATAVLRYLDFSLDLGNSEDREQVIAEAVVLFQNLLHRDS